jgi:hypothetical protein
MIDYILISNDIDICDYAYDSGVDYIMIDLEVLGKVDRQKNFNMVQNYHSVNDIEIFRKKFPTKKLIVRSNSPKYHDLSEIDQILSFSPDFLMIPFFDKYSEIEKIVEKVRGTTTQIIPLFETASSLFRLHDFVDKNTINNYYIGLNDLRLTIGYDFLFESVSNDLIDYASKIIFKNLNNKFGFGGISRIGSGDLPAELVLSEHVRLKSSYIILSRAFHSNSTSYKEMKSNIDLPLEIRKLREKELEFSSQSIDVLEANHLHLRDIVRKICKY